MGCDYGLFFRNDEETSAESVCDLLGAKLLLSSYSHPLLQTFLFPGLVECGGNGILPHGSVIGTNESDTDLALWTHLIWISLVAIRRERRANDSRDLVLFLLRGMRSMVRNRHMVDP